MASSKDTPLFGPYQPRIDRRREVRYYSTERKFGGQARDGVTKAEKPWVWTTIRPPKPNVERITDTIRNPKFKPFMSKNFFDDGGKLLIEKSKWSFNDVNLTTQWRNDNRYSYGLIVNPINWFDGSFPIGSEYPPQEDTTAQPYHALAYKALRPDKPAVDLLNAVVELRDFAHTSFSAIKNIKDISDYWLALNFGWLPLFTDIKKLFNACRTLDDRLRFFIRNNGKPIRAKKEVFSDSTSSILYTANDVGISRNTWVDWEGRTSLNSAWRWQVSKTYSTRVWASGRFIVWMKDIELPSTQKFAQMGLLGLNPTPSVVWNALPWTWLLDWITNIGDILDNMSSSMGNRLVSEYFYVMRETSRSYEFFGTDGYYQCSAIHSFESKVRDIGHPYGLAFGSALTPFRLSILAALGAQRF